MNTAKNITVDDIKPGIYYCIRPKEYCRLISEMIFNMGIGYGQQGHKNSPMPVTRNMWICLMLTKRGDKVFSLYWTTTETMHRYPENHVATDLCSFFRIAHYAVDSGKI